MIDDDDKEQQTENRGSQSRVLGRANISTTTNLRDSLGSPEPLQDQPPDRDESRNPVTLPPERSKVPSPGPASAAPVATQRGQPPAPGLANPQIQAFRTFQEGPYVSPPRPQSPLRPRSNAVDSDQSDDDMQSTKNSSKDPSPPLYVWDDRSDDAEPDEWREFQAQLQASLRLRTRDFSPTRRRNVGAPPPPLPPVAVCHGGNSVTRGSRIIPDGPSCTCSQHDSKAPQSQSGGQASTADATPSPNMTTLTIPHPPISGPCCEQPVWDLMQYLNLNLQHLNITILFCGQPPTGPACARCGTLGWACRYIPNMTCLVCRFDGVPCPPPVDQAE